MLQLFANVVMATSTTFAVTVALQGCSCKTKFKDGVKATTNLTSSDASGSGSSSPPESSEESVHVNATDPHHLKPVFLHNNVGPRTNLRPGSSSTGSSVPKFSVNSENSTPTSDVSGSGSFSPPKSKAKSKSKGPVLDVDIHVDDPDAPEHHGGGTGHHDAADPPHLVPVFLHNNVGPRTATYNPGSEYEDTLEPGHWSDSRKKTAVLFAVWMLKLEKMDVKTFTASDLVAEIKVDLPDEMGKWGAVLDGRDQLMQTKLPQRKGPLEVVVIDVDWTFVHRPLDAFDDLIGQLFLMWKNPPDVKIFIAVMGNEKGLPTEEKQRVRTAKVHKEYPTVEVHFARMDQFFSHDA